MAVDRLSLLRESRDLLADDLREATDPAKRATVSRELRAVLSEIDSIPGSGEVTDFDRLADGIQDDLAAQRAKRQAG